MNLHGMRRHGTSDEVDVVVIGTGAGGAPVLATLAGAGLRVVALEAGPNLDPHAFTPDETAATADLNWMDERLSSGEDPTAFGPNNSGRGVGGSSLHWGAFTPRPDPRDLTLRSTTGAGVDWPISPDELTGYLARAERRIGVSGPAAYPWDPARRYPMPPTRRNASSDMMIRGCAELGITATDAPAAVLTRDNADAHAGHRSACAACGSCHQGCRIGAKGSMDTSYLPDAVAAGAEIRPEATAVDLETGPDGRITAVVYVQDGARIRQATRAVVLAAGGVETPRLLLHTGLANGSGQVGRNFLAHGGTQVWGTFETPMRGYRGYPSSIITEDFLRPADADFAGGYLLQSLGVQPGTLATTLVRGGGLWGRELIDALDAYPRMAGVGMNGECLPHADNRLELAAETDALGVPRAHIRFSAHANEHAMETHAVAVMRRIVEAAGGRDIRVLARTAHTIGTARMGTDPATSVVDPDGRSHDIPNLWVCDNSVFPSALPANPLLTIVALGLRTAERMLAAPDLPPGAPMDQLDLTDPRTAFPVISPPVQQQEEPGLQSRMTPVPDLGEERYRGTGRLTGRRALITGGDSGIGGAVAIAYAREGADVAIVHLPEEQSDADHVLEVVRAAGRTGVSIAGDLTDPDFCRALPGRAVEALGGLDALVHVAGRQIWVPRMEDLAFDQFESTYRVNVFAPFLITQAALPHLTPGSTVIVTASAEAYSPAPDRLDYASTKGAINNLGKGMALQLIERGIRVNVVAPGPTWTVLQVTHGVDPESLPEFGSSEAPIGRAAQPVEIASAYVYLASAESSFVVGATLNINGGMVTP